MFPTIPTPSALAFVYPPRYIDTDAVEGLDIERFSDRFIWRQDAWGGWRDTLQPVAETVATRRGDCEDLAFVAASWCIANDRPVSIGLCFSGWHLEHAVAIGPERVYSSGRIHDTDAAGYRERSVYDRVVQRRVRATPTA